MAANQFPVPDLRETMTTPSREEDMGNAESVVGQAYRLLTDYSEFTKNNIKEAQAKLAHWQNEYEIVQRFLAKDQSDAAKAKHDDFMPDDF